MTYIYPEWLTEINVTWFDLNPYIREYFLRMAGYVINDDGCQLEDVPESETLVKENFYNFFDEIHIWEAMGFYKAKKISETNNNLEMNSSSIYLMLVYWIAKVIYEDGVNNKWWNENLSKSDFISQYKWAKSL